MLVSHLSLSPLVNIHSLTVTRTFAKHVGKVGRTAPNPLPKVLAIVLIFTSWCGPPCCSLDVIYFSTAIATTFTSVQLYLAIAHCLSLPMTISLFYHYTTIPNVEALAARLRPLGPALKLAGRIRLSTEGINATLGGTEASVQAFHDVVLSELNHPNIDFKLASGSSLHFPEGWIVRTCKELVTLGVPPEQASWCHAAPHLDPATFRDEVLAACAEERIVLDVRNNYEHAIGRFQSAVLSPIRQFSDFPKFISDNQDSFKNKRVLMYCTGGVRCERASAYLLNTGVASSVAQLRGGIDRFLKEYPDGGGVFQGKNLVFDTRMAVATEKPVIVGACLVCDSPWDDYSSNWRCSRCRCRLLICGNEPCTNYMSVPGGRLCVTCRGDL